PAVSSLLAMLPYWSFALWYHRKGWPTSALVLAAFPLLLPVEFGAMTTMSRGFVTGIALLALFPWLACIKRPRPRSLGLGAVCSLAWYINPNTLVVIPALLIHHVLTQKRWLQCSLFLLLGAALGIAAHLHAQQWCIDHPTWIVHRLQGAKPDLGLSGIIAGLSDLDAHFRWLMPVFWPYGGLLGVWLLSLLTLSFSRTKWAMGVALSVSAFAICLSFTMDKVHDGWNSIYFPLSRIFLGLPLLVAWATATLLGTYRAGRWIALMVLIVCIGATTIRAWSTSAITERQVQAQWRWVGVKPYDMLLDDAKRLLEVSKVEHIGLITPTRTGFIWPQFRAYLHPVLQPGLPPTYLAGYERRYWVKQAFSDSVVDTLLITGGSTDQWASICEEDPRFIRIVDSGKDEVHILRGNTLPTDSILGIINRKLGQEW
ncbi:MAG: hypothetical protein ABIY71_05395, partial [Flavobacteriales bacterium]